MDGAYDELGKLKAELDKLKKECYTKKELYESLRKAHDELLVKFREAEALIEEQVHQLNGKTEELSELRQISENLKSSLDEKESSLSHLNFVNEKLRAEFDEKVQTLEEQNKGLVLALSDAIVKNQESERAICASNEEIQGLKRLLLISQKKCLEAEENTKVSKELKCRDNIILEIEEENRNVKDKLKWKTEQFQHLQEAHVRLQDQFHQGKVEWEKEKSEFLEDIYSLKTSLDSQTRTSENLHSQLKMCNQALSYEESKRKVLEAEVLELRSHFENVVLEFEQAQSNIGKLPLLRDEDIAELRNELGIKETLSKEMKYRIAHLEQEKDELRGLLKELREEQIKLAGCISLKKLQNKIRSLEKLHSQCSINLKEKEAEWNSLLEKMTGVKNGYISDLRNKDREIQELQKKLDGCHCLLEFQNENEEIMYSEKAEMDLKKEGREQSGNEKSALSQVGCDPVLELLEERFQCKRAASFNHTEHQVSVMEEHFNRNDGNLDELPKCQVRLKEQFALMETTFKRSSEDIWYLLELANDELAKKIHEVNQAKLELQEWKSRAKKKKAYLEEYQEILKQEKDSLVGVVKEQDEKIGTFQQMIVILDTSIAAKRKDIKAIKQGKEYYYRMAENKDSSIKKLKDEIVRLKQESAERARERVIQAQLAAEIFKQEEERLLEVIDDLHTQAMSLQQDFERELVSSFSVITEKQIQFDVLKEAIENAEREKGLEIQEKSSKISALAKEINHLHQKRKFQEESLLHSNNKVAELEAVLNAQKLETEELKHQFWSKQAQLEGLDIEHRREKENLLEDMTKLSSEREDMLAQMEAVHNWITYFSNKDADLMSNLEKILQNTGNKIGHAMDLASDGHGLSDSPSKVVEIPLCPSTKSVKENIHKRSPLKALNH